MLLDERCAAFAAREPGLAFGFAGFAADEEAGAVEPFVRCCGRVVVVGAVERGG